MAVGDGASLVAHALSIARNSDLKHPDKAFLDAFLTGAGDVELASCYFMRRCFGESCRLDSLATFVSDWKIIIVVFQRCLVSSNEGLLRDSSLAEISARDGGLCYITGKSGISQDNLVVAPILSLCEFTLGNEANFVELLEAFLTPPLARWLLCHSGTNSRKISLGESHWLVRKSAQTAFQNCHVGIRAESSKGFVSQVVVGGPPSRRLKDIPTSRRFRIPDKSSSGMDMPLPELLRLQFHFAHAVRWLCVAREISTRSPDLNAPSCRLSGLNARSGMLHWLARSVLATWLLFPSDLRSSLYGKLRSVGNKWYGKTDLNAQKLPLGMYLKFGPNDINDKHIGEFRALQIVRRHTSIPVPYPMDCVSHGEDSFLLTSAIPGEPIGYHIDHFSDDDQAVLINDLKNYVGELRAVAKEDKELCGFPITSAMGGPIFDYRISLDPVGPFVDESAFNERLKLGATPNTVHCTGHKIVFTHADFNMRNILVDPRTRRLSGIVDWENAGWYPEYWEYTKAYFITKLAWRWLAIMDAVFGGKERYKRELETETTLWTFDDPWS